MSQNLVGIIKKYQGKYYVFPETAEVVVSDAERYIGPPGEEGIYDSEHYETLPEEEWKRELEITDYSTLGPYNTLEAAMKESELDFYDGYFEYGLSCSDYIDEVKLVLTYEGKEVQNEII